MFGVGIVGVLVIALLIAAALFGLVFVIVMVGGAQDRRRHGPR